MNRIIEIDNMTMNNNRNMKPHRPCTEYNIFFQLERACILQVELNDTTTLSPEDTFQTSQHSYATQNLPNMPARFAHLTLAYDWFLPGKEKRRKRKHRKSHGKISFHELSLKVAAAWKVVPDEIRIYCAHVCSAGTDRYKIEMMEWKKRQGEIVDESHGPVTKKRRTNKSSAKSQRQRSTKAKKTKDLDKKYSPDYLPPRDKDVTMTTSQELPPIEPFPVAGLSGTGDGSFPEICELFEHGLGFDPEETAFLDTSQAMPPSGNFSRLRSSATSTLDMSEEEILQMWNVPVRRSSVVLGFGMTNGQYRIGHMPCSVQSEAVITRSMPVQSQQPVRMGNIQTAKRAVEQKKVGLGSVKQCSMRACAA